MIIWYLNPAETVLRVRIISAMYECSGLFTVISAANIHTHAQRICLYAHKSAHMHTHTHTHLHRWSDDSSSLPAYKVTSPPPRACVTACNKK